VSLSAALAAAACGGPSATAEHIPVIPETTVAPTATLDPTAAPAPALTASSSSAGRGIPVTVDVPAIGVHATQIVITGLDHGAPAVPPTSKPQTLGVYGYGSAPCSAGPAKVPFVALGHIDGSGMNGIFHDLKNLKPGNVVTVALDNGTKCSYRINKLAQFDKVNLKNGGPTAAAAKEIWGPVPVGSIRLISCGGAYIGAPLYYASNLVGEGTLVS